MKARACESREVMPLLVARHYLHRRVGAVYAFALDAGNRVMGAVTFGVPPSRHVQMSACPTDPSLVIELNRLWIDDAMPPNTASEFVWSALRQLPPRIVVSYCDLAAGFIGGVYRAMNWHYAGWTDEDRKTPRYDYVVAGKHSRDAFRCGEYARVRRQPKLRFWCVTGSARQRRRLLTICGWESRPWDGGPR